MNEETKETKEIKANKISILTVRLGKEEKEMIDILKKAPHWINISEYIRATIRHLYESKINKAGRIK